MGRSSSRKKSRSCACAGFLTRLWIPLFLSSPHAPTRGLLFHGAWCGGLHVLLHPQHPVLLCRCIVHSWRMRDAGGGARHIRTSLRAKRPKRDGFGVSRSATGCGAFGLPWRGLYQKALFWARKGLPKGRPSRVISSLCDPLLVGSASPSRTRDTVA